MACEHGSVSWDEAFAVAQAAGQRVIGIDSSPAMLRQARARAGVELHLRDRDLRDRDLRDLALDEQAGLSCCPFRALLHLPAWADRRRTFERVASLWWAAKNKWLGLLDVAGKEVTA
jgi:hypothetical protein